MELRFAVVEDRLPDAQRLESLLRLAFGGGHTLVCDHYESGDAFLQAFPSKNHQVVFLDICMEGTNGIETARILRRTDPDLLLVFVTSSPEYVWDAFPVHPFDYLLKPYREEKLFQLADELRRVLFRAEPELEVRIARQQVHLPLRKIQYAMAQNHYVRIVSDDGECRAVSTFSQVEQLLRAQEMLTAGLCMANGGGAGDVQCLGAAHRMELMSYAQISSRIGGAIMLVIASFVFGKFL